MQGGSPRIFVGAWVVQQGRTRHISDRARRASSGFRLRGVCGAGVLPIGRSRLPRGRSRGAARLPVRLVGCDFGVVAGVPAFHPRLPNGIHLVSAHWTFLIRVCDPEFGAASGLACRLFFFGFCISFDLCCFGGTASAGLLSGFLAIVQEQRTRHISDSTCCLSGGVCRVRA